MKKYLALFAVLAFAATLILTLAAPGTAAAQPVDDALGQGCPPYDVSVPVFAVTTPLVHVERDPKWTDAVYSFSVAYFLPAALPSPSASRAPPA